MKLKTVKTAQKRFKVSGSGKLLRRTLSAQHLVQGKSKRTLRRNTKLSEASFSNNKKMKKLIPYR